MPLTGFSSSVTFAENTVNTTPQLLDSDVVFTNTTSLANGRLVVAGLLAEDRVSILTQGTGAGQIGFTGGTLSYGGVAFGTATGGVGGSFTVTFNASVTAVMVDALIQRLSYQNVSNAPTVTRNLTLNVFDATGPTLGSGGIGPLSELTGTANPFNLLDAGFSSTPAFVDLDGDGDLDLVSGSGDGPLLAWRSTGTLAALVFDPLTGPANPFNGFTIGLTSGPAFVDLDADGDFDLVAGLRDGTFQTWRNTGSNAAPIFAPLTGAANPLNGLTTSPSSYSRPAFVDFDGDGDLDFVSGALDGTILAWRNTGTAAAPVFTALTGTANPFNGIDINPFGPGSRGNSAPNFVDLDGDGDLDLVSGERYGKFYAWRNTGTAAAPVFTALTGSDNPFNGLDVGSFSAPAFVDLDGDGDLDFVAGESNGTLLAWRNTAALRPTIAVTVTAQNDAPAVTSGATASFTENGTGIAYQAIGSDPDSGTTLSWTLGGTDALLFNINAATGVVTFKNAPNFEAPAGARANNVYDITVTASDGTLSSAARAVAITVTNLLEGPMLAGFAPSVTFAENTANTTPQLLDGDVTFTSETSLSGGRLVVSGLLAEDRVSVLHQGTTAGLIGFASGTVSFGGTAFGTATGGSGANFTVTFNANATTAAVDALIQRLSYQTVSDTPTATRNLTLNVVDGAGQGLGLGGLAALSQLTGAANPFDAITGVIFTAITFVNLDGDGDLDLVAGGVNGDFRAWRNTGSAAAPVFTALTGSENPFNGLSALSISTPAFVDLDGDGDLDLVSGSFFGTISAWRNTGTAAAPVFTVLSGAQNPFNGLDAGDYSTPAFADLDGDGDLDLVSGLADGTFAAWRNTGTNAAPAYTRLTGANNPLNGFDAGSLSSPQFVDLDGDGDLDLVSGGNPGVFVAWRNTGTTAAPVFVALTGSDNPLGGADGGSLSRPAVVDLDRDGDLDLVSSNFFGEIRAWSNNAPFPGIAVTVTAQNDAPSVISLGTASFAENGTGTAYQAAGTDPEGTTLSWSLAGTDAALFNINAVNGAVSFKTPPNFEAPADSGADHVYNITVTASDGTASSAARPVAITVTNVNEFAPIVTSGEAVSFAENGTGVAYQAAGLDADAGTTISWSLGGVDAFWFTINTATGAVAFRQPPDFETRVDSGGDNVYNLTVTASDGALSSAARAVAITVTNLVDGPTVTSAATASFAENGTGTAYQATATAPQAAGSRSWTMGGADAALFNINATTGAVTFKTAPNFEAPTDSDQNNTYNITVTASDGALIGAALAVAITVTNVNEFAPTVISAATASFAENGAGTAYQAGGSDADAGTTLSWSLGGTDSSFFNINAANGAVTFKTAPNFEVRSDSDADNIYRITVTASDGTLSSAATPVAITVTNVNEAPSVTSLATANFAENGTGTAYQAAGSDPDAGTTLSWSLAGTDAALFNINATTGAVTFKTAPNFEVRSDSDADNIYRITVTASDGTLSSAATPVAITVTNVNEFAPTVSSGAAATFAENGAGIAYQATGTDADTGTTLTWALAGVDAALFNINTTTGAVTFKTAPNFEVRSDSDADNIYRITVTASDGTLSSAATPVAITVTNVNEAPSVTSAGTASFAENGTGTAYQAVGSDADAGTTLTWALAGADAALFNINTSTGAVTFKTAPNFEVRSDSDADNIYRITVTASDGTLSSAATPVAITVTNVNEAPSVTSAATASFAENGTGTAYQAAGSDPDAGTTLSWSLAGTDAALFNINATTGAVTFKTAPNFEVRSDSDADNIYRITVTASDGTLSSAASPVAITVTNVNEAPSVTSAGTASFAENGTGTAYQAAGSDPDAGTTLSWSLGGTDAALFNINTSTGVVTFKAAPNFEVRGDSDADNIYRITLTASDGTSSSAATPVAITVTNVNEAPSVTSAGTASFAENGTGTAYQAVGSDADAGTTLSWTLGGTDAALFDINAATGAVTFRAAPDFEVRSDSGANNVYDITVTASDGMLSSTAHVVSITVTNVNEFAPSVTSGEAASFAENDTGIVYQATGSDADANTTLSWTLDGIDAALFDINAATGAVTFKTAPNFESPADAGGDNIYDITVTASDGTRSSAVRAVTITVTNVNEFAPIVTSGEAASYAENDTGIVYQATGSDADAGTTLSWSLDGADAALFDMDAATGAVTFKSAPNFEFPADAGGDNIYDITVTASDGTRSSTVRAVTITVTNANEFAPIVTSGETASYAENDTGIAYQATGSDADAGATLSWTLDGADAALFDMDAATGAVTFKTAPNFEFPADAGGDNIYDITVTASDGTRSSTVRAVTITVTNVNEFAPIVTSGEAASFAENDTGIVYQATGSDADAGATLSWSLDGADAALFDMDAATGAVTFKTAPNFESPADAGGDNIYDITVTASDGTRSSTARAVTITVTNVNEFAPIVTSGEAASFAENDTGIVYQATGSDADAGATLSWSLDGADAALFDMDAATGAVTFKTAPNFESPADAGGDNIYDITVTASDGTLSSTARAVTITVTNVNEFAPIVTSGETASFAENDTGIAYQAIGSDADASTTLSWTLDGTDAALFDMDAATGAVTFKTAPNFESPADAGGDNIYDITVTASDGTRSSTARAVTITVTNVNEFAPIVTSGEAASFAENDTGIVYQATGSDADAGATLSWSLDGADAALFDMDAATGTVTFKAAPNFESPADANGDNIYDIMVTASDGTRSSTARAVSITVTNVVEGATLTGFTPSISFAENTANTAPQLLDSDVIFLAPDSRFDGGRLVVSQLLAEDRVSILAEGAGVGQIGVSGNTVTYGGLAIGSATGGSGGIFTVAFNANASAEAVDALIQRLAYRNVSDTPTETRALTLNVVDGAGIGLGGPAQFTQPLVGTANPFSDMDIGPRNRPAFADLDGDGKLDLVGGEYEGELLAWRNTGTAVAPVFTALDGAENPLGSVNAGFNASPAFMDLDADGDLDLVAGGATGKLLAWRNTGTAAAPVFTELTGSDNPFSGMSAGSITRPAFGDLDGDGDLDLVAGEVSGRFLAWRNTGTAAAPVFTPLTASNNPLNGFDVGFNSAPAFVDLDGDGDLDLVSGERLGTLLAWRNTGTPAEPVFTPLTGANNPFSGLDVGIISTPAFADLDGDGDLDLVSGEYFGSLFAWRNTAAPLPSTTITITPEGDAPVITSGSTGSIAENAAGLVYQAVSFNPDGGTAPTWTLSGVDAGLFDIDRLTGAVTFKARPDFELPADTGADNVYDLTVTASDGVLSTIQEVAITVTNVNEAPTVTSPDMVNFAENGTGTVYTATGTDPDAGSTLTWTLGGADAALFAISGAGVLTFRAAPNFEAPIDADINGVYDITITASDGVLRSAAQAVAITVTNVNEAPSITSAALVTFAENGAGTAYQAAGTDPDAGTALTWSLAGTDAVLFDINASGAVTFRAAPNFEVPADANGDNVYAITVIASDGVLTASQPVAILVTNVDEGVNAVGGIGADLLIGSDFNDTLSGDAGNDTLLGSAGNDTLIGDAGNDVLMGGAGADLLEGGEGTDSVSYSGSTLGVVVNLITQTASDGDAAGDTISGFENAFGGNGDDRLTGDALNNSLSGGTGNDTLIGGVGDDTLEGGLGADSMTGGEGNDTYSVDDLGDAVLEVAGAGYDRIVASFSYTLGVEFERLSLLGSANLNGTGNALANRLDGNVGANILEGGAGNDGLYGLGGNDTLIGGLGNDTLDGGLGADSMTGGEGNDTYHVDDLGDAVVEVAGGGNDRVIASLSYTLGVEFERLSLLGSANLNGTGNALANRLDGNAGANILDGGEGNDGLYGLGGNDTLIGGLGNDTLEGGLGADSMTGGEGNDTYYVDDLGDAVVEVAGGGYDRVIASFSYTLGVEFERLSLLGSADLNGTGHALTNRLDGNAGANILDGGEGNDGLYGLGGNDTLIGGLGNDTLEGGFGADSMTGGLGADRFVFRSAAEAHGDFIADFSVAQGDRIDLRPIDTNPNLEGDQAFVWAASGDFGGVAGQLRSHSGMLEGDMDGDAVADFQIGLGGGASLTAANIWL
jgi:VCBS repeat-containing protein